jgi:acetylornithine deacetylase/succinyl-diaminopimelate desuccinylase-like protein
MTDQQPARPSQLAASTAEVSPHPVIARVDWDAAGREAADLLSAYVRIDSSHPRGRTIETADFLQEILEREGLETRRYPTPEPDRVNMASWLRAERPHGKAICLSSHMDVVQAVASDWTFDPFSGEISDGYVYGRGTLDMKGMGIMELLAVLLLKRLGIELTRDVLLLHTSDEEIGSTLGAKLLVDEHYADLDPAFVLDEGGSGMRGFFSQGDVFAVSVGEKRIIWMKIVARDRPGHASSPDPDDAMHRLVRAAGKILAELPNERAEGAVAEMIERLGGERAREEIRSYRATRPLLRDTISFTMLEGGYKINVIPERAEMSLDCRLLPGTDEREFIARLEQIVDDPAVTFEVGWPNAPAATAPWDSESPFSAIEQACRAHAPASVVTPSLFVAGTDGRFFRQRGVPSYGLVPCIFTAEDLKGYHGIDERLSLENLTLGTKIILDLTARLVTS